MRVLSAGDEPGSRRLLQSYLQKWGYEVTAAADGAEAWRLFEAGDAPVVITDWMMPEVDGAELIRRIRAAPRPGYVYTVLLTARSQKEDLVEGMEAGAEAGPRHRQEPPRLRPARRGRVPGRRPGRGRGVGRRDGAARGRGEGRPAGNRARPAAPGGLPAGKAEPGFPQPAGERDPGVP